jgi:AraC-like DNA-binding protein
MALIRRARDAGRVEDLPYQERASRVPGVVVWQRRTSRASASRILPDGCMDLIWNNGRLLIAGPDREAFIGPVGGGGWYVGLRFPPGVGPAVFGLPAAELVGRRVPLEDAWSRLDARRIADAAAAGTIGRVLEDVAGARLEAAGPDPVAARVVARLDAGRSVHEIAADLALSERQLHRRCLAAFGYGPKTLSRIRRMQRALAMPASVPAAAVAATAGYADQAHLTREVRALAGVPFGQLLNRRASPDGSAVSS